MSLIAPTWLQTACDLHLAASARDLWAVLLSWHGVRGSSMWDEPYALFMKFHREEPTDAEVTAALLCTDYRWRTASHHVIDQLARSDALSPAQLDQLSAWFTAGAFEIVVAPARARAGEEETLHRPIWPPLRRWAARRQVERRPARWRDVTDAASSLPGRDAAATVAGVMDAFEHVPSGDLPALVSIGTGHGSGVVRLAVLPAIAMTAGVDAAMAQARSDPSGAVRAWKPPTRGRRDDGTSEVAPSADRQPTLFD